MAINRAKWFRFRVALGAATVLSAAGCAYNARYDYDAGGVCERTITAQVVALDQAFYNNRLGAFQAGGMIFALKRDVVSTNTANAGQACTSSPDACSPGKVRLRDGKRARPIALRMNVGDCMNVRFTNLLASNQETAKDGGAPFKVPRLTKEANPQPVLPENAAAIQPATRLAGLHVAGMQLIAAQSAASPPGLPRQPIDAAGHWVGANDAFNPSASDELSGLVRPGASIDYTIYAGA
ncbi:MAG: hypothetical protein O7G83_21730, partial [Proteobacteria bacterium]|nr:hypothetical protein [Pseudomonadota bacterium]